MARRKIEKIPDLDRFIKQFQSDRYKVIEAGSRIEIRAYDLEIQRDFAQQIINEFNLNLKIYMNAEMSAYRAFEIRTI